MASSCLIGGKCCGFTVTVSISPILQSTWARGRPGLLALLLGETQLREDGDVAGPCRRALVEPDILGRCTSHNFETP